MANYDAGHYFLTTMAPIDRNTFVEVNGVNRSAIDHIRFLLNTLPTAQQDDVSAASGLQSPFASVPGVHFAHFFVIDDVRYNGRRPSNPILNLIFNTKMTNPEEVDRLPDAYLVLVTDFDASDGSKGNLRGHTDALWANMGDILRDIYAHVEGFDRVETSADFYRFVREGQIETTMPFNDYWAEPVRLPSPLPWMLGATALILFVTILLGATGTWTGSLWGLWGLGLLALLAVNIGIVVKYGLTPFPAAPDSDLQSVLKAIYIQQMFTGFAIDHLGRPEEELKGAFEAFCERHVPRDPSGPSQDPGVLLTPWKSS
ncbi:MAG: hypothetical protein HKN30_06825 [Sulfitobacter sp.]|nr:hypothetical protein [Sulfitobacter sp.]